MQVKFYDNIEDEKLLFAVILTKHNNKWVFCKHKSRNTYEIPGGHREQGETILETAKRELYEETGAIKYEIKPVTVYSVIDGDTETFGKLYFAEVQEFEKELHSEIELIKLFDDMPENLTYPLIQPKLMEVYKQQMCQHCWHIWVGQTISKLSDTHLTKIKSKKEVLYYEI